MHDKSHVATNDKSNMPPTQRPLVWKPVGVSPQKDDGELDTLLKPAMSLSRTAYAFLAIVLAALACGGIALATHEIGRSSCQQKNETDALEDGMCEVSMQTNDVGAPSAVQKKWYDALMVMVRDTRGVTPPNAARAFGYISAVNFEIAFEGATAMHQRSQHLRNELSNYVIYSEFDQVIPSIYTQIFEPSVHRKLSYLEIDAAINYAFKEMLVHFFVDSCVNQTVEAAPPKRRAGVEFGICPTDEQKVTNAKLINSTFEDIKAGIGLANDNVAWSNGVAYARSMIDFSRGDGGETANFRYRGAAYPGSWTPTTDFVVNGTVLGNLHDGLQHRWGFNRPFTSPACIADSQPPLPPTFDQAPHTLFYNRAESLYIETNQNTEEHKVIAEYWSDDPGTTATPPGHSISIANQVAVRLGLDAKEQALLFAMVGAAINDAFISCWKTKYDTNYVRPISYINQHIDAAWSPLLITPPFPEYTSGHSVQTAAAVQVLKALVGDIPFNDTTHVARTDINGNPRTFSSLSEMAREAANSRIYGGIHYKEAVELGMYQGERIGSCVVQQFRSALSYESPSTCSNVRTQYHKSQCCAEPETTQLPFLLQFALRNDAVL